MRVIALCLAVAVALTALLPTQALKGAAEGLLAFTGLLIGMLMPTMALTATALRPGQKSPRYTSQTGRALFHQFDYWVAMLWLALTLAGLLIFGNVVNWTAFSYTIETRYGDVLLRPLAVLNVAIWTTLGLLTVKLRGFVTGFRSLLKLHVRQVLDEVRSTDPAQDEPRQAAIKARPPDASFGKLIE